jgi:hypothetical protein
MPDQKMKGTPEWQALGEVKESSMKMSRMTFGRENQPVA